MDYFHSFFLAANHWGMLWGLTIKPNLGDSLTVVRTLLFPHC
jgi:hypothetical protein